MTQTTKTLLEITIPILLAAGAALLAVLRHNGKLAAITAVLPALVTEAERLFGLDTGMIKLSWVVEQVYDRLPETVTSWVSAKQIERLIEAALKKTRPAWVRKPGLICTSGKTE